MDNLKDKIGEQANYTLEAVENAISISNSQTNRGLLPRIKEIVIEIANGDYDHLHELKGIMVSNTPEGSGPDNDIFVMDVQGGGLANSLQSFLDDLINLVEQSVESNQRE